jgi:periplasmic protein TonB
MFAQFTDGLNQGKSPSKQRDMLLLLSATLCSVILHGLIAYNWQPPAAEELTAKAPLVVEVTMVTLPPPKPLPVVKSLEPPKPKVVKPKQPDKPKPKIPPKVKPPEPKAPPKVMQKTFIESAPEIKSAKPTTYTPVPVFAPPVKPKPGPIATAKSGASNNQSSGASSGVVALSRVKPKYPARALSRRIEGYVTIQFTVNASGSVENATVSNAVPPDIFNESALSAIRQWKFKQKIVNGVAVSQRAVQTLKFKLDN